MTTTIAKLAVLVLRHIGGGIITDDLQPKQPTVEYYVGLAIRYAFIAEYRNNRREEQRDRTSTDWSSFISRSFLTEYKLPVQRDCEDVFVDLPVKPMDVGGSRWLDRVFVNRSKSFVLLKSADEVYGMNEEELGGNTVAWPENNRIYFLYLSPLSREVKVLMAPDPLGMDSNTDLSLPPGAEIQILELARNWFLGLKQVPSDIINDNINQ